MSQASQIDKLPQWLTPEQVADVLESSARTVRRRAMRDGWLTRVVSCRGGRRLEIHRSVLAPPPEPTPREAEMLHLSRAPEWARARAEARRDLLVLIEERLKNGSKSKQRKALLARYNDDVLAPELGQRLGRVSYRTYLRWLSAYHAAGLPGLLPANKGRRTETPPDVAARLRELALSRPRAAAVVYDYLVEEFGERAPSYRTVLRQVQQVREEHAEECLLKFKGPTAHRHAVLPALGQSDAKAKYPNHMWEIDSTPADMVDAEGKRRKVIGIVDIYTRRYLFRVHRDGSGLSVAQSIRSAILAWGLPDVIIMDNGHDYQSRRVQTLCEELGIHVISCLPYQPEGKPHVERSFRTLSRRVCRELTGSTGYDLTSRPEVIVPRYTAEQIQGLIDKWVDNYWHERVIPGRGKRPRELAGERVSRRVSDERVLDVLLGDVGKRKVRQGYIRYRGRKYFHELLLTLDAFTAVELREDWADVGRIYVFHRGRYLCTAVDLAVLGMTPKDYTRMKRRKLSLAKARVAALEAGFSNDDPDAHFVDFLARLEKKKPAQLDRRKKLVEFPKLEAAVQDEAVPEPASEASDERPTYWDSPADRYEWILRRQAASGDLLPEDLEFMRSYEGSPEYRDTKEGWDFLREQLALEVMEG